MLCTQLCLQPVTHPPSLTSCAPLFLLTHTYSSMHPMHQPAACLSASQPMQLCKCTSAFYSTACSPLLPTPCCLQLLLHPLQLLFACLYLCLAFHGCFLFLCTIHHCVVLCIQQALCLMELLFQLTQLCLQPVQQPKRRSWFDTTLKHGTNSKLTPAQPSLMPPAPASVSLGFRQFHLAFPDLIDLCSRLFWCLPAASVWFAAV